MPNEIVEEVTDLLGFNKSKQPKKTTISKEADNKTEIITATDSEIALSKYLTVDKQLETEEIVPCCTYFFWGSYLACCTEDINSLKLLGVVVSKRRNPMDFDNSRLYVKSIKATNVRSVEFIGKNDLYLDLFLGKWSTRTKVIPDCGAEGSWEYADSLVIDASSKTLSTQKFRTAAYDKNKLLSDVLIGEGSVNLKNLLEIGFDKEQSFSFPLLDKDSSQVGMISVNFILRKLV